MLVCEIVAKYIADSAIDVQFGVVGEGNLAVVTALHELGVRYVPARREDAAVGMADGWARRRPGRVGFASVTSGPGLTNTVTSLVEAARRHSSIVVLVSLTPPSALHHPQRLDAQAMVATTGAGWVELRSRQHLARDVHSAFRGAAVERRPYVLALPQDLLYLEVDDLLLTGELPEAVPEPLASIGRAHPDPDRIDAAADEIARAMRPLVVAGRGVFDADAEQQVTELAERLGAPLTTTLLGRGMFRDHPQHVGIFGGFSTEHGSEIIPGADLVIALGCSLNPWTTMQGELLDGARLVHCDHDPRSIGCWNRPDVAIVGDARVTATALLDAVGARREPWARPETSSAGADPATAAPLATVDVARSLATTLPPDVTLAFDSGHAMGDLIPRIPVSGPERFIYGLHAGAIGLGIGLGIGAAVAAAPEWTVLITGDGALTMSAQELDTVRRLALPLVIVVVDDGAYGAEIHYSATRGIPDTHAYTDNPDFVTLAEGFGIPGRRVERLGDLASIGELIGGPPGPVLVHVPVAPEPMNRWYGAFASGIARARWSGLAG